MNRKVLFIVSILLLGFLSAGKAQSFMNTRLKNVKGKQSSIVKEAGDSELIVLDFWATWCKPCVKSIPKISELSEEFGAEGVKFIGVNADSPRNLAKVKPFVNTHGIKYPVLLDTGQEVMNELLINAFPTLLIINRDGEVLYSHRGFANGDEKLIRTEIKSLLSK